MTTAVTWENLKEEFSKNSGPGILWYEVVKKIARSKANSLINRKVPPSVYGFTDWNVQDLVQEVFTERLIGRSQAQYIFDHAADLEHCKALLANEVSYTLEKKRVPNQLNNVWDNLQPRLEKLGWAPPTTSYIDDQIVKRLKLVVLNLKRLRNKGQLRFSALFAPAQLDMLAHTMVTDFPLASKSTLFEALREAFTIISPAMSVHVVGDSSEAEKFGLDIDPEGENLFSEDVDKYSELHLTIANEICEKVGLEGQEIMFHLAAGSTQSEIAAALGTYRSKLKEQIEAIHTKLEGLFDDLRIDEPDKVQVLGAVLWVLGADGIKNGKLQRKNQPENEGQANEE